MAVIQILPVELSNKIAAGEVVERPASVVKELVENAIDARSRRIFVAILEGGIRLIQVVDDGEGISRAEVPVAFQRHATSKISDEAGLATISTLGFRGEALPSIASVSKVSLVSKRADETEGTEIKIEGGTIESIQAAGCPQGSTFEVRDLFYNVPARRKFLKAQQTEMAHISRVFSTLALAHADIHFRLTHGGRTIFDTPTAESFKERAFQLLGDKIVEGALVLSETSPVQEGLSLKALLSCPPLKRNLKKEQYLFVNGRPVRSPLLTHAVYEAYKSYLMKGEEPFFVLFLTIDPSEVDVNVHPGKLEVRFQNTNQVHQAIRNIIREALSSAGAGPLNQSLSSSFGTEAFEDHFRRVGGVDTSAASRSRSTGNRAYLSSGSEDPWVGWPELGSETGPRSAGNRGELLKEGASVYRPRNREERLAPFSTSSIFQHGLSELPGASTSADGLSPRDGVPLIRPLAQVYGTFLLAEVDGDLVMVDQHTAHERVLYEEFLSAWPRGNDAGHPLEIQPLLIPQQVDLPFSKSAVLRDHIHLLEEAGCKIESFGETTFLIRELPALIAKMDVASFLDEVVEDLMDLGVTGVVDQCIRTIVSSMACHGAVRAHQSMSLPEIKALLEMYFQRKTPSTCPHGRPIVIRYSLLDLEKLFRRK